VPGFRTWRGVYWFVFACFVLVVVALTLVRPVLRMNTLDWVVLLGTMVGIAAYGARGARATPINLNTYLKGNRTRPSWFTIGVSVMPPRRPAPSRSSRIPGQGFESGIGFVQNYFGLPLALIIVCAVFLPIYRKLGVYTAYEYLGKRFDGRRRACSVPASSSSSAASSLGVTIYAPAIILSTVPSAGGSTSPSSARVCSWPSFTPSPAAARPSTSPRNGRWPSSSAA
jgi:hypothetical protein